MEKPPIALQIVFLGKHLSHLMDQRLAHRGLNRTQAIILTVLSRHPGLQAQELCAPAGVEPANVTRTLQSLERLGLLERRPHPTDGRAHLFLLTERGRTLARELSEEIQEVSAALLEEMDPEERPHLDRLMSSLWKAVGHQLSAASSRQGVGTGQEGSTGNGTDEHRDIMSRKKQIADS